MPSPSLSSDELAELEAYRRWVPQIQSVCKAAAAGDLEPRLLNIDVDGELGAALTSINHLLDLIDCFVRESAAALEYASNGKFFRTVLEDGLLGSFRRGAHVINTASANMAAKSDALQEARRHQLELADAFEATSQRVISNVADAAAALQQTSKTLSGAADETTRQADVVARSVAVATDGLDSITLANEDLSKAVGSISKQVTDGAQLTRDAVRESEGASDRATRLSDSSERIGSVVHIIRQVAEQTNLLALNATIEAARAGEVGRGFAVVASEVKDLSAETGDATQEIQDKVSEISSETRSVVSSIEDVGQTLARLDEMTSTIAAAMEEQAAASAEMTRNTHTVADSTRKVMHTIDDVRTAADETSQSSGLVLESADDLKQASDTLQAEVRGFLAELRGEAAHS